MAKRKSKKTSPLTLLIIVIAIIYGLFSNNIDETYSKPNESNQTIPTSNLTDNDNTLKVYFLDVGQADSILIKNKNEYMLIDAGNNEDGSLLVDYFNSLNITEFKYLIGTHPHEDHIGGLDDIINNFKINKIYIPDAFTTTKTFETVLDAIENNNLTYHIPTINETFTLGDANLKVIYTGTDITDLNNTSIILKMTYNNISFLFTGDATSKTEKQILNKDIKADILKVAHHGSKYSSTDDFLDKVNPSYAIISVGTNNSYNHPEEETLEKLNERNIETYRTDELGTIQITTDGTSINITNYSTQTNG